MKKIFLSLLLTLSSTSYAMVLDWQGSYRFEGVQLENADLDSNRKDTSYILHHLYLKPKMIASDGLVVNARLDLFNNSAFANSQMGQFFGNGPGSATPKNETDSNVLSQTQKDEQISVTELYLTANSEYGQLIAGRKLFHFGLGISHNAGKNPFDHYFDSKDMVAYRMSTGNFTFTPIFAKVNEGKLNLGDDITDYIFDISYHNHETETQFGILYESRITGGWGNDAPIGTTAGDVFGGSATAAKNDHWNGQRLNLFYERKFTEIRVGFEASTTSAETGIITPTESVSVSGFGFAFEIDYKPSTRWAYAIKTGLASGDDPTTASKYEGFIFDRNYNVGFMLMNHVLGKYDVFRTSLGRRSSVAGDASASAFADEEALSNVMYFVPEFYYHWKPNLDLGLRLVWAKLNVQPALNKTVDTNLGYEVDFNLQFKPSEKIVWLNELGLVFPGAAFTRSGDFQKEYAWGITTKAAISF